MASPAEEVDVDGVAVRLTSPDKVYFPKLGAKGTKRTLFDYYLAVADPMLRRSIRSAYRRSIPITSRRAR
jgi:DNA primase